MRTKKLTAEECHLLSEKFPIMSNVEVAKLLGVSVTTVKNYADIMELKKESAYISNIRNKASIKGHLVRWGVTKNELH